MKIFAISDLHGKIEVLSSLEEVIKKEKPDTVVFTGDIVKGKARGDEWLIAEKEGRIPRRDLSEILKSEAEDISVYHSFYQVFKKINVPLIFVPGNMDAPERFYFKTALTEEMVGSSLYLVHHSFSIYDKDYVFAGFGGEITADKREDFFVLQYPSWEAKYGLDFTRQLFQKKIFLFHTPPVGKVDFEAGIHRGNEFVNQLIKTYNPVAAFCGHAHKAQAYEYIGDTLVVNPGAMKDGNYSIVDLSAKEVSFGKM